MRGKIIKGIAGFYYVHVADAGIYECKAKGIFRNRGIKPLVGDDARLVILDEREKEGNIEEILPRQNELVRPAVANIDQALVIFAAADPAPNFNLLDRFLLMMECQGVPALICFNKLDLALGGELSGYAGIYAACGYPIVCTSAERGEGIGELMGLLEGKTTAVAGPSGVGKSSLINCLQTGVRMDTGEVSRKLGRGRHTTRHTELIPIHGSTYIMDTPGFSSLDLPGLKKEELWRYFPEFAGYGERCRFRGCSHISEPGCGVKEALSEGKISPRRYESYKMFYEELKEMRKY